MGADHIRSSKKVDCSGKSVQCRVQGEKSKMPTYRDFDIDGGWKEAVVSVHDLPLWVDLANREFGWTLAHQGPVGRDQLDAWGLAAAVTAQEALFHCGDEPQGVVRFVSFRGAAQLWIRAGAMPWDTGGIFSLMLRARDIQAVTTGMLKRGWTLTTDPVTFDYNGQLLTNVILRGPDGVGFGVYERVKPALEGWPHVKRLSQPFNCMQIVQNRDATRDFHRDVLGFGAFVDDDTRNAQPVDSNFGFPRNLTTQYTTKAAIMHPRGKAGAKERDNGRVELIQWDGFSGRDLSARAVAPNLGNLMLRWAVADAPRRAADIAAKGVPLYRPVTKVDANPYGPVQAFAVRTPDGVIYELFSVA
jgi:catechol 2,3-dioxygenase-like lactoylglutathione lyase family enzyme